MGTDLKPALSDLIWASLPLKDLLKGDQRAAFVQALASGTAALSGRYLESPDGAAMHPAQAAEAMHRQCLLTCLALGVPPRNLAPQFNQIVETGCARTSVAYRLARLGETVAATATAHMKQEEDASDEQE